MGYSHREVAEKWWEGKSAKGMNMFTDGVSVWSYGTHFPLATKVKGITFINTDYYSSSTSKHQCYVNRASSGEVIEVNTDQILSILRNPDKPIVIVKEHIPMDHGKIVAALREFCRTRGVKRFPTKQYIDGIEKMVFMAKL